MADEDAFKGSRFATAAAGAADKKEASPPTAERFAEVTASMHRFLNRLSDFDPFHDAGIGITEWSVMNALAKDSVTEKQVIRDLGLTKQRFKQVRETLKRLDYINVASVEDEPQRSVLSLSPVGRTHLTNLNSKLTPMLTERLQGRERSLDMVGKGVKNLMRVLTDPKDKAAKKDKEADSE